MPLEIGCCLLWELDELLVETGQFQGLAEENLEFGLEFSKLGGLVVERVKAAAIALVGSG